MNKSFNDSADNSIQVFTNLLDVIQKSNSITEDIKVGLNIRFSEDDLKGFDFIKKINDIASLIAISNLDLTVTSKFLYNASNNWEKIYCIKNAYLTIFETFKTYNKYRQFLNEVSSGLTISIIEDFKCINNSIKAFKIRYSYDNKMSIIRNNISGHISDNLELYYNTIVQFDGDKTAEMIIDFLKITNDLEWFLIKILDQEKSKNNNQELIEIAKKIMPDLNDKINLL
ncbi:hypothetical protein LIV57_08845 [Chryseobacterium sp. X308]|uniref:hypothetical protein n=1 Tax=Chryseobacterium sp. X308 TaxID=2884873 RepID=UPI001D144E59|nr:hypothetical protein [Chryseobacterium sp. X308]MCC3215380.1 hypothetical protein [Chryseobacterium sp. X308]